MTPTYLHHLSSLTRHLGRVVVVGVAAFALNGCYVINFIKGGSDGGGDDDGMTPNGTVIGNTLGPRAGTVNDEALRAVAAVQTSHSPAAIRPDPDVFVRRLLRQYRSEGATVARQTGQVEQFRLLLGGASQDFAKAPQETYDATSLLAVSKVAEEICRGLVAPNATEHPGWATILPHPPEREQENIAWLAQRIIGKPSSKIDASVAPALTQIMVAEEPYVAQATWGAGNPYAKYVPVCATLAMDAEALVF